MMEPSTCLDRKIDGNYHLGHFVLECFKTKKPDDICQINSTTGEEETYESVLNRILALARSLRRAGFQPGDVLVLSGQNHLNLRIPYYAALMNGLPVAGITPDYKYEETKKSLRIVLPKIVFCEYENYELYSRAVEELGLDTKIFTFYGGEFSMAKFVEKFDTKETGDFWPYYFDTDKVYAFLISTSGTTGDVKFAAIKHCAALVSIKAILGFNRPNLLNTQLYKQCQRTTLNMTPVDWITSYYNNIVNPLFNICILQVPKITISALIDVINKYKPSTMSSNPTTMSLILKHEKHCDLSCLDILSIGGAKVYKEIVLKLKENLREEAKIKVGYGQTETMPGIIYTTENVPLGSCGTDIGVNKLREYYNNPEDTEKAITEDGWFKTGDIMYRDEHGNYYFVERLKMLIKYRIVHIIPTELEELLETHPGVLEACVTSIPHMEDGERPAAAVVRRAGVPVTAQEIKDLIADKLSDSKQLRGGVVFMDSLPKTSSGKVSRAKVRDLVRAMQRE